MSERDGEPLLVGITQNRDKLGQVIFRRVPAPIPEEAVWHSSAAGGSGINEKSSPGSHW